MAGCAASTGGLLKQPLPPRLRRGELQWPRGDKSAYSSKQKRQAEHIEDSVRERGGSEEDAERIGWATVNKQTGARGRKKTQRRPRANRRGKRRRKSPLASRRANRWPRRPRANPQRRRRHAIHGRRRTQDNTQGAGQEGRTQERAQGAREKSRSQDRTQITLTASVLSCKYANRIHTPARRDRRRAIPGSRRAMDM